MKIHVDTDFGGDIDDICALALLLKSRDVDITGITTVAENGGKRAGQVVYTLHVAGRAGIPVKAGADNSGGFYPMQLGLPLEEAYWPEPIQAAPSPIDEALNLLKSSIDGGATIVAIGPLTNLYLLDKTCPGILQKADIVFMGGYVHPPCPGYPEWKNEFDFNKQIDIASARHVFEQAKVTLVQLSVTVKTFLREADLEALERSGPLGRLLARQAAQFAVDEKMAGKYSDCENLPRDIINFHYDPLTAAVALGWTGVTIEEIPLVCEMKDRILEERIDASGKRFKVVTDVEGERFNDYWLQAVTAAS